MSETDKGEAPEAETIIQRYYAARRKRVVARRTVTLTTILIALVYLFLIWNRIDYFRSYEIPILSAKLNAEATRYLPKLAEEVQAMTERVVPVYLNSFGEALNENEELYVTVLIEEFDKLERYSRLSWEKMEIAIAQMVLDQEQAVKGALGDILSDEELAHASNAYRQALENNIETMFTEHFREQITAGEEVLRNLQKIALSEPNLPPDDVQYLIGMLLELLGMQMQVERGTYDYIVE